MRRTAAILLIVSGLLGMGCGEDDADSTDVADTIEIGGDVDGDGDGETDVGEVGEVGDVGDTAQDGDVSVDADTAPELLLHVPSPDWREQVIYFVFTDRFADGDPTNNDQGAGEYDPSTTSHYSGGDLQGIIDRLDYIQGLGATAVWITPPVANLWWDPLSQFGGFHGYWARDFTAVDEHQGTLATYQALSDALHKRGMYLIQDIVTNHTGNFFTWSGAYDPAQPETNFVRNLDAKPGFAPTQPPFDHNDLGNSADVAAGIYHWTPAIADYTDPVQEKTWQTSDLDDLATENPVVRKALRESYGGWIEKVGVDGFRIDTAKFVEQDFWNDFLHGTDPTAPGMHAVAAATGRDNFLAFGEVFQASEPMDDAGDRIVTSYLGTVAKPGLDAVLGFPLYEELSRVIGGGQPTRHLAYRLGVTSDESLYRNPYITPNFLDNHDVQRFLAASSEGAFEQALLVLFTVPGIPVVFQGTEQAFSETRASLFAAGWMSGGVDHFDTGSSQYALVKALSLMRRGHPALTQGKLEVLADNPAGPGVLAFERVLAGGKTALVLLNTAEEDVLVAGLASGLPAGTQLTVLTSLRAGDPVHVGRAGEVTTVLPARASLVLEATETVVAVLEASVTLTVDTAIDGETFTEDVVITGKVTPTTTKLQLVVDGYIGRAPLVTPAADGSWSANLAVLLMPYGDNEHTLVVYAPDAKEASATMAFRTSTSFDGEIITVADPLGDDVGPAGTYVYPQDTTFVNARSMDIEKLVIEAGPATLRLRFTMGEQSTVWNPSNGFDHTCFNVYFDVPGLAGLTLLPKIQATIPAAADGFAWDFTHFAYGWGNSLHKTQGASTSEMGGPVPGRPSIVVDAASQTIIFEYQASTFGLQSWAGVKVYATTWDFDGIDARYRPLSPAGGQWLMGGGAETDPYIMDSVGPVTLPASESP